MSAVLIAALSGRALASAARADGYTPLVADLFGDLDLDGLAARALRAEGDLAEGFDAESLLDALEKLARDTKPIGLVYGTGFEDRPDLLAALGERWRVLGNPAPVLARAKDPWTLASLCADLGLPPLPYGALGENLRLSGIMLGELPNGTELTLPSGARLRLHQQTDPCINASKELAATPDVRPGDSAELTVDLDPGAYALVCTVPGHREQGMIGTIKVE